MLKTHKHAHMATKAIPGSCDTTGPETTIEPTNESKDTEILSDTRARYHLMKGALDGYIPRDNRGSSFMDDGIDYAVGILVVGLLAAYLLPIAINEITGVDTSAWGSAESQLWGILPIFIVLGIVLFIVRKAK